MDSALVGAEAARTTSAAAVGALLSRRLRPRPPPATSFLPLTAAPLRRTLRQLSVHVPSAAEPSTPADVDEEGLEEEEENLQSLRHRTLIVENIHRTRRLRNLLSKLSGGGATATASASAWNSDEFWTAANFLVRNLRHGDALQLFDEWRTSSPDRSSPSNFSKMAHLLSAAGAVAETSSLLSVMAELQLAAPISLYNSLLRALGRKKMYDEMCRLLKKMKSDGCCCEPNAATFNLLIMEFAGAGLLRKMEAAHGTILSRKMNLLPASIAAMAEAYAEVGDVPKMEKNFRRLLSSSRFPLKEDLIRKIALVYIKNFRFSRLEELADEVAARTGRTGLVWMILLLASALLLSRRGMESIAREMSSAMAEPRITFINIMALAHARMKGFKDLEILLGEIGEYGDLKPDLITVGVLFDACACGFHGGRVMDVWKRKGFFERKVEMETDPLVFAGFGKGNFVRCCEELFPMSGQDEADDDDDKRKKKGWTYVDLIRMLFQNGKLV